MLAPAKPELGGGVKPRRAAVGAAKQSKQQNGHYWSLNCICMVFARSLNGLRMAIQCLFNGH
eukprot:1732624-Lingulodinium_polyedra.AAC.1